MIAEIMASHVALKKHRGELNKSCLPEGYGQGVSRDIRDEVIDYVRYWSERTGLARGRPVRWIGMRTNGLLRSGNSGVRCIPDVPRHAKPGAMVSLLRSFRNSTRMPPAHPGGECSLPWPCSSLSSRPGDGLFHSSSLGAGTGAGYQATGHCSRAFSTRSLIKAGSNGFKT